MLVESSTFRTPAGGRSKISRYQYQHAPRQYRNTHLVPRHNTRPVQCTLYQALSRGEGVRESAAGRLVADSLCQYRTLPRASVYHSSTGHSLASSRCQYQTVHSELARVRRTRDSSGECYLRNGGLVATTPSVPDTAYQRPSTAWASTGHSVADT
eukprot:1352769-Rhodomonas_salina.3